MHPSRLGLLLFVPAILAAACGGSDKEADPTATAAPATSASSVASADDGGELAPGKTVRSRDGSLSVTSTGGTTLQLAFGRVANPPAAPSGWSLSGQAFDITARDKDRAVTKLESPVELRFKAPEGRAVVMYHDGSKWVIVESERNSDGTISAKTDHFTPYAVAVPKGETGTGQAGKYAPTPAAQGIATRTASVARPSVTVEIPTPSGTARAGVTPGAGQTAVGGVATPGGSIQTAVAGSVTPGATATAIANGGGLVSTATVSSSGAKTELEKAAAKFKNRQVIVTGASGYSATVAGSATATLLYGLYGGVNEVITNSPTSSTLQGTYIFLSEPKTAMPSNTTDAQSQLLVIFPGVAGVKFKAVSESPTSYIYLAQGATEVYTIGFAQVNGVAIAYLAYGTGNYMQAAVDASARP